MKNSCYELSELVNHFDTNIFQISQVGLPKFCWLTIGDCCSSILHRLAALNIYFISQECSTIHNKHNTPLH